MIGNPPYVRIQNLQEYSPEQPPYFKTNYHSAGKGNYDIYVVFVEKGLQLLNPQGRLGFILPHKFFNAQYGEPLRRVIAEGQHIEQIVHFGDQQVFETATTYTCLLFLSRETRSQANVTMVSSLDDWRTAEQGTTAIVEASGFGASEWNVTVGDAAELYSRLLDMPRKLGEIATVFVGTQTSADDVFVIEECAVGGGKVRGYSPALDAPVEVELAATVPFLRGKEIRRYADLNGASRLICPYDIRKDSFSLIDEERFATAYPKAYQHLAANKPKLAGRERGKYAGANWYAFGYPKSMTLFQKDKIVVPDYNNEASFTYDTRGHYYKTGYGVITAVPGTSPLYVLGLLNSRLLYALLSSFTTKLRGGYVRFWTQYISQLPIRPIDFSDPADLARHDRMVGLVQTMLDLHQRLPAAQTPRDRELLQRQIADTDRAIDALVYELYDLTAEEIALVEGER